MKKAAVISFAAFYLLLSTGMYVCLMHCLSASMFKPAAADCCKNMVMNLPAKGKHQPGNKTDNCCEKHSNFLVKENIKPSNIGEAPVLPITLASFAIAYQDRLSLHFIEDKNAFYSKAPPPISARCYLIQIRSLLI